jgi:hypothetical protein
MSQEENTSPEDPKAPRALDESGDIQPSWKPLLWFLGGLAVLLGLWEVLLEFGLNLFELIFDILENVWLVLIEAPEEFLEDLIAEWLDNHFPHDADRYSEIITAFGLTPLKIFLVFLILRWAWRHSRERLIPRIVAWFRHRVAEVRLAWFYLPWMYKVLLGVVAVGSLFLFI